MTLDLQYVRSQFPSLAGGWTFFDNAGGSQTARPVIDRLTDYLCTSNVQLGATYAPSLTAGERVLSATEQVATLVNAEYASEVVMGSSTTMLLRILSLGLARYLAPGDEVIVTNCDHEANIGPWIALADRGVTVKTWSLNRESYRLQTEELQRLMTDRTRLVAVPHVSNILGTINPIREIADMVHERGAWICVDGVAFAPHRLVDVRELDVDFYAYSFYKVYGPHQAVLYGKREHMLAIPGWNHFFFDESSLPAKFQPGGVNYELTASLGGIGDYLQGVASAHQVQETELRSASRQVFSLIADHEQTLSKQLLDFLDSKPKVRVIGDLRPAADFRVPTMSFVIDGTHSGSIPPEIDKQRIGIRYGHFYAKRLIDDLGLAERGGVVRVSMVHYNTLEEVDRLTAALDPLI
ncbi:MAG: cysteine desulfurase-like protein [Candidatus Krumholzibacteria bacterium]|nr:cysteine desulfurase-like protein [Candidatus Krumholzibacteria bacterium]